VTLREFIDMLLNSPAWLLAVYWLLYVAYDSFMRGFFERLVEELFNRNKKDDLPPVVHNYYTTLTQTERAAVEKKLEQFMKEQGRWPGLKS